MLMVPVVASEMPVPDPVPAVCIVVLGYLVLYPPAQRLKRGEQYWILYIQNVLDGDRRQMFRLVNPYLPTSAGFYRSVATRPHFHLMLPTSPLRRSSSIHKRSNGD